jgi:hypothetical protein
MHALLGYPVSENFVSWCQTLKNSSASFLCIQETYIISTISQHRHWFHSKNIFLITFKLRDTGTCFFPKIYAPPLFRKRKRRGHIFFE